MQHNTMAKGKEKQSSTKHYIENYTSRSTKVTKNGKRGVEPWCSERVEHN
jgi:hypothetical protein